MAIRLVADTALIQLALFCALTVRFCIVVVFELQLQDVEGTSEVEKLLHLYINSYVGHFAPLTIFCLIIFLHLRALLSGPIQGFDRRSSGITGLLVVFPRPAILNARRGD